MGDMIIAEAGSVPAAADALNTEFLAHLDSWACGFWTDCQTLARGYAKGVPDLYRRGEKSNLQEAGCTISSHTGTHLTHTLSLLSRYYSSLPKAGKLPKSEFFSHLLNELHLIALIPRITKDYHFSVSKWTKPLGSLACRICIGQLYLSFSLPRTTNPQKSYRVPARQGGLLPAANNQTKPVKRKGIGLTDGPSFHPLAGKDGKGRYDLAVHVDASSRKSNVCLSARSNRRFCISAAQRTSRLAYAF
jgi:hypothetical protein